MKYTALLFLFILFACNVDVKVEKSSTDELIKEAKTAVVDLGNAYAKADTAKLKLMLADVYLHTNPDGKTISKKDWLKWVGKRKTEIENGALVIDVYETRDLNIRLLSDRVFVADGIVYSTGTQNSEPFEVNIRFTQVWIKANGNWERTVFHDSRINN